uniref:Uncharacterized protein n=1 Tax=Anguilla anguilla TaxID=7936 RepID=A0A0E9PPC6_ANGAN
MDLTPFRLWSVTLDYRPEYIPG